MKVNIGKYVNFLGPYQIAEKILFWKDKYEDDIVHDFGTWLATNKAGEQSYIAKACNWVYSKQKRKIKVRIDSYDVWNMDATLAVVVLPMLRILRDKKHGTPFVDDSDVPQEIRSTTAAPKENDWDTDEFFHQRWSYVLNEMIWTFEQHTDENSEGQFHDHSAVTPDMDVIAQIYSIKIDQDGLSKHNARKQKGFELFGKYFQCLWT